MQTHDYSSENKLLAMLNFVIRDTLATAHSSAQLTARLEDEIKRVLDEDSDYGDSAPNSPILTPVAFHRPARPERRTG